MQYHPPSLSDIRIASLEDLDPFTADLLRWEDELQVNKLVLIPSVSAAPRAVLQALGSSIQNVCAEGLPSPRMTSGSEADLQDTAWQLANLRRYADRRFYKGVSYVDFAESLAKMRCAEAFATETVQATDLHVSVQALSGGIANLAVYQALLQPGDTLMGMALTEGGHLSHGSKLNLSGQLYNVVSYATDPRTEKLDYDRIRDLARQHRPRLIIAGYTAYPWMPDWQAFREIADEVGAYLLADIAHTAGLVVAGVVPTPVGIADVVSLTTNKTLCGPRSAAVLTTDKHLAGLIEAAVFPGQQGAPHPNKFAAVAVAFAIARTEAFQQLQRQIVTNARAFAQALADRGVRIVHGGTDTHLFLIDLKSIPSPTGEILYGEPASRILELAGIIVNKNAIPGDTDTALATGLRLGTPWLSQRGLQEEDMQELAGVIHQVLAGIYPFTYTGKVGLLPRGKIDLPVLEAARARIRRLVEATNDTDHLAAPASNNGDIPKFSETISAFLIQGPRARAFVQQAVTANIATLQPGEHRLAYLLDRHGKAIDRVRVTFKERNSYLITPSSEQMERVGAWLWALSDGYVLFDTGDVRRKVEGPVTITPVEEVEPLEVASTAGRDGQELLAADPEAFDLCKPYFIGQAHLPEPRHTAALDALPAPASQSDLKRTPLYGKHLDHGARMVPFAGWEMPLRYASVVEEHRAVRTGAGLFDVAHMGIFEISGPHALNFLDVVFSNYVAWLDDMQACYGYILDPDGAVIDDAIVYRLDAERFLMVVNAVNEARVWQWLHAVNRGQVVLDRSRPWVRVEAPAVLANLKGSEAGERALRDLALQGPASLPTLQRLVGDPALQFRLQQLPKNGLLAATLAGIPVLLARTGYTGEEWGFELFAHPDHLPALWDAILEAGADLGVKPVGLGARDSVRIEAGLPLYGQDLAGPFDLDPIEAGFPGFVKYHKPFFIGRDAMLMKEDARDRTVVRFHVDASRARMGHTGDVMLDQKGRPVGRVTSCSVNAERQQIGLAWVEKAWMQPGTRLTMLPGSHRNDQRKSVPVPVVVQLRFPETV